MPIDHLASFKKQFTYYKILGEKAMEQIPEEKLFWQYNPGSNSIAIIVKHLWGNMISRWTDFLTSDGEKDWRKRDAEFENDIDTRAALMEKWAEGWNCLFAALDSLTIADLEKEVFIRNMGQPVLEAIIRQLAHYPYHIGQMVFISKMVCGENWISLSIPKGNSIEYNREKFAKPKQTQHFTDEFLKSKKDGLA